MQTMPVRRKKQDDISAQSLSVVVRHVPLKAVKKLAQQHSFILSRVVVQVAQVYRRRLELHVDHQPLKATADPPSCEIRPREE